jgi:hypothetical protein
VADDQDWRLRAELDTAIERGALDRLIGRTRGPDVLSEVGRAVPHDVVITHDGRLLFAYAASEPALAAARKAIEAVLRQDGAAATISVSNWDRELDRWRQTDPPATPELQRSEQAAEQDAKTVEARTLVASSGKMVRAEFEQSMRDWAKTLGLEFEVIEHPHMLTTQVAFTVTGPRGRIEEFAQGLRAEELATLRTERMVMLSPL